MEKPNEQTMKKMTTKELEAGEPKGAKEPEVKDVEEAGYTDEAEQATTEELNDAELKTLRIGGGTKPVFAEPTKSRITEVRIVKSDRRATDKQGVLHTPVLVKLVSQTEDGRTSFDTYGGGRLYPNPIEESAMNFWKGETSDLGKLLSLVKDKLPEKPTLLDLKEALTGTKVMLKTVSRQFQGEDHQKNIVVDVQNE